MIVVGREQVVDGQSGSSMMVVLGGQRVGRVEGALAHGASCWLVLLVVRSRVFGGEVTRLCSLLCIVVQGNEAEASKYITTSCLFNF